MDAINGQVKTLEKLLSSKDKYVEMEDDLADGSVAGNIKCKSDNLEDVVAEDDIDECSEDVDESSDDVDDTEENNSDGNELDVNDEEKEEGTDDSNEEEEETAEKVKPSEMDIVKDVLERAAKEAEQNEFIAVTKHLNLEYDLGTLLATDLNNLDFDLLRNSTDEYLKNLARDNTQLLINHIWELPITRKENEIVAKLPKPKYKLPREKKVPVPKTLTKWAEFAQDKGIKKKTRKRAQWDETLQKWVPWWGYKRVKAQNEKDWVIEAKQNDDPMEDPYAKKKIAKQERIAKNELQRLRNLAKANNVKIPRDDKMYAEKKGKKDKQRQYNPKRASKINSEPVPRMGFLTSEKLNSAQLKQAITVSKASTASLGKFQSRLPKEKEARNVDRLMPMAKKRKAVFLNREQERKANLDVIDGLLKKRPKMDITKAVNKHIHQEERQRAEEKSQKPKGKGRGKSRGGGKGNLKGKGAGKVKMGNKVGNKGGNKGHKGGGKKKR